MDVTLQFASIWLSNLFLLDSPFQAYELEPAHEFERFSSWFTPEGTNVLILLT